MPRCLFFENVKGLLHHEQGKTFATIIRTLDELGYDCQWQVLNSSDFKLPQNRERIYIIGTFRGTPRPEVFPFGKESAGHSLPRKRNLNTPTVKIREASKQGYAVAEVGDSIETSFPNSKHRRGRIGKGYAHTLVTGMGICTLTKEGRIRKLTPLECERLQGFPDGWTKEGLDEKGHAVNMSDTQRYKCLGNAVSTPVIDAIAKKLLQSLGLL